MVNWIESKPTPSDIPNAELPSLITTNKLAFRQAIEKHSFWTDSSTNFIGIPRLSDGSAGPGSARAFYDTHSQLSISTSLTNLPPKPFDGRLYVTSDTSYLFGMLAFFPGPTGTAIVTLGSKNCVTFQPGSFATIQGNTRVLVQRGTATVVATNSSTSTAAVTFSTKYNVAPTMQLTVQSNDTTTISLPDVTSVTTSGFVVALRQVFFSANTPCTIFWRSHGTVAL